MDSRMNKYYDDEQVGNTRVHKNENLYKEISKSELEGYEVKSNATIIGDNEPSIDVEKIKKILDTKYNEAPRRQSIRIEEEKEEEEKNPLDDTKEYDINAILEKAKEKKPNNYEEERLKKLHDTNFDILKKIKVSEKKEEHIVTEDSEIDNLENLINTIAINEKEIRNQSDNKKEAINDALDILSDLKGDDDTEVLEGLKEEVTHEITLDDSIENNIKDITKIDSSKEEKEDKVEEKKEDLTNSFYTTSNKISKKDFDDSDDFSKDINSNNTFLKIVIGIIVVIFIVGVLLLIKTIYAS